MQISFLLDLRSVMDKKVWSLFLPFVMGLASLEAGWVYQSDESSKNEIYEEEDDFEMLGLLEEDLEEDYSFGSKEKSLDEFSFLDEQAKEAPFDSEENLALDSQNEDFEEDYLPSMESIPQRRKSFLSERSAESEAQNKRKMKPFSNKKDMSMKKNRKLPMRKKPIASVKQPRKLDSNKEPNSKAPESYFPKKRPVLKERKGSLVQRPKQKNERLLSK